MKARFIYILLLIASVVSAQNETKLYPVQIDQSGAGTQDVLRWEDSKWKPSIALNHLNGNLYTTRKLAIGGSTPLADLHVTAGHDAIIDGKLWLDHNKSYGLYHNNSTRFYYVIRGAEVLELINIGGTGAQQKVRQYSIGGTGDTYPAFAFMQDYNTGMARYGEDDLSLSTGGTTRFRINNTDAYLTTYQSSRVDAGSAVNFLSTNAVGKIESRPISSLPFTSNWTVTGEEINPTSANTIGLKSSAGGLKMSTSAPYWGYAYELPANHSTGFARQVGSVYREGVGHVGAIGFYGNGTDVTRMYVDLNGANHTSTDFRLEEAGLTLGSLTGAGDRMVTASPSGLLTASAIPDSVRQVGSYTALRSLVYSGNLVVVKDFTYTYQGKTYTTEGGVFQKASCTENGGTCIGGKWKRIWDKNTVQAEWWRVGGYDHQAVIANGNTGVGCTGEGSRIQSALSVLIDGGVLQLKGGKEYVLEDEIDIPKLNVGVNVKIEGNYARLKREDARHSKLTVAASAGSNTLTVTDGSKFKVGDNILVTYGKTFAEKSSGSSGWHAVTTVSGNVLTINNTIVKAQPVNADVFTINVNAMIGCSNASLSSDVRLQIENVIFDGNSSKNDFTYDWVVNQCINLSGADRAKVVANNLEFYNHPTEVNVLGTHWHYTNTTAKNIGGAVWHGSISIGGKNEQKQHAMVSGARLDSIALHNLQNGHNAVVGGVYTQSVGTGQITFENLRVKDCLGGLFSGLMYHVSDGINIIDSHFENADHIWAAGDQAFINGVHIEGNQFINCGVLRSGGSATATPMYNVDWVIANNTFKNTKISLYPSQGCKIVDNTFEITSDYNFSSKTINTEQNAVIAISGYDNDISQNIIKQTGSQVSIAVWLGLANTNNNTISNNNITGVASGIYQPYGANYLSKTRVMDNYINIPSGSTGKGIVTIATSEVISNHVVQPNAVAAIEVLGRTSNTGVHANKYDTYCQNNIVEGSTHAASYVFQVYGISVLDNKTEGDYYYFTGQQNHRVHNNLKFSGSVVSGAGDYGTQKSHTDVTISGDGTAASPLSLNPIHLHGSAPYKASVPAGTYKRKIVVSSSENINYISADSTVTISTQGLYRFEVSVNQSIIPNQDRMDQFVFYKNSTLNESIQLIAPSYSSSIVHNANGVSYKTVQSGDSFSIHQNVVSGDLQNFKLTITKID